MLILLPFYAFIPYSGKCEYCAQLFDAGENEIDVIALVLIHKLERKIVIPLPLASYPYNVLLVLYLFVFV